MSVVICALEISYGRSRTVRSPRICSTTGRKTGSNAISEHVVNPARLSLASSARSIAG